MGLRFLLISLLCALAACALRAGAAEPSMLTLEGKEILLRFDQKTGALAEVVYRPARMRLAGGDPAAPTAVVSLDGKEIATVTGLALKGWRKGAGSFELTFVGAGWRIRESYRLAGPASWKRSLTVTRLGSGKAKIRGVRFLMPGVGIGRPADTYLEFPGSFPPRPLRLDRLREGSQPGGWPCFLLHNARARLSFLAMAFNRSEDTGIRADASPGRAAPVIEPRVQARMRPGHSETVGTAYYEAVPGSRIDALKAFQGWYARSGVRPPKDTPRWGQNAVLYSAHPGGVTHFWFKGAGGFRPFARQLPALKWLGVTALWLLPIYANPNSPYAPIDYYRLDPALGTPEECRALVREAHRQGIRVLFDLIPHGPRAEGPLLKAHPEFVARDEKGDLLYWWDCLSTDYANPAFGKWFADMAAWYVRAYGIDGWRVDCAGGGPPNWDETAPYRASFSGLGGSLGLLKTVRERMKAQKPDSLLFPEVFGDPLQFINGDWVYDYPFFVAMRAYKSCASPSEWVRQIAAWLEAQKYVYPRGATLVRFTENHDTGRSAGLFGHSLMEAMFALCAFAPGVPMIYQEQEAGHSEAFARILKARRFLPGQDMTDASYTRARSSSPDVLTLWREKDGRSALALINFAPSATSARISLPFMQRHTAQDVSSGERLPVTPAASPEVQARLKPFEWRILLFEDSRKAARPASRKAKAAPEPLPAETPIPYPGSPGLRPLSGKDAPGPVKAARRPDTLLLPRARRWFAHTTSGLLSDRYERKHFDPRSPEGFNRLWDSRTAPLHPATLLCGVHDGQRWILLRSLSPERPLAFYESPEGLAIRAEGAEGGPGWQALGLNVSSSPVSRALIERFCRAREETALPGASGPVRLHVANHQFTVENSRFRAVLDATSGGRLRAIYRAGSAEPAAGPADFYTDAGFYERGRYAGMSLEVEARPSWEWQPDGSLRLSFEGCLRDYGWNSVNTGVPQPATRYRIDYLIGTSASLKVEVSISPDASRQNLSAFLGQRISLPGMFRWALETGPERFSGTARPSGERFWQSASHGGRLPLWIEGRGPHGRVRLSGIEGDGLQNIFLLADETGLCPYLTFLDNHPTDWNAGERRTLRFNLEVGE
ncbi:MAG: hypothetical protein IT210_19895 [Armatimonadetes bacterium]|nr:hypothetical protein [Armatimonadota bacterium]